LQRILSIPLVTPGMQDILSQIQITFSHDIHSWTRHCIPSSVRLVASSIRHVAPQDLPVTPPDLPVASPRAQNTSTTTSINPATPRTHEVGRGRQPSSPRKPRFHHLVAHAEHPSATIINTDLPQVYPSLPQVYPKSNQSLTKVYQRRSKYDLVITETNQAYCYNFRSSSGLVIWKL
jgi:hypothetical protein